MKETVHYGEFVKAVCQSSIHAYLTAQGQELSWCPWKQWYLSSDH